MMMWSGRFLLLNLVVVLSSVTVVADAHNAVERQEDLASFSLLMDVEQQRDLQQGDCTCYPGDSIYSSCGGLSERSPDNWCQRQGDGWEFCCGESSSDCCQATPGGIVVFWLVVVVVVFAIVLASCSCCACCPWHDHLCCAKCQCCECCNGGRRQRRNNNHTPSVSPPAVTTTTSTSYPAAASPAGTATVDATGNIVYSTTTAGPPTESADPYGKNNEYYDSPAIPATTLPATMELAPTTSSDTGTFAASRYGPA